MNIAALLGLIADLYAQLTAANDRIAELEAELSKPTGSAGATGP